MTTYQNLINNRHRPSYCQGYGYSLRVLAVIDRDNLYNRGAGRPRATVTMELFARALKFRGICGGMAFSHFFPAREREEWRDTGLKLVETRANCDWHLSSAIANYVKEGCDWLVLVSGDGDFLPVVRLARLLGVRIELWYRPDSVSRDLLQEVDRHRRIDDMIVEPLVGIATESLRPNYHEEYA